MALVSEGFYVYVTLVDNGANTSTLSYALVTTDEAQALTDASAIVSNLAAVTNAAIKGYTVSRRFIENALALPGAGVQVEDRASVVVQLASSPLKSSTIVIPAPEIDLFLSTDGDGANIIDVGPGNTDLRAYVAMFNDGGAGICTLSDGETVDASASNTGIKRGVRTHRGSSRG